MLHQHEPLQTQRQHDELAAIVRASAAGDQAAFERLVARFDRLLRGITRFYRLSSWDADDVIQATWLQFLQHGRTLREPAAVSGWLATTARRQSFRVLQRHVREHLTDDPARSESAGDVTPDDELLAAERRELVHDALSDLPPRHQNLMRVLVTQPELSYEDVGRLLAMPVGSIGPTRARSLDRLRQSTKLQALH
ncbi:MAG: sigma-70 family RNA polymerase sigma factor, partial [Gemmatimonadota bacterium]|nr:sigma-70 family RNA polymerase sigma factor [Gemmatimonadota bacterium]